MLEKKGMLPKDYEIFYSSLVEIKKLDRKGGIYFDVTISELKNRLSSFLQSLQLSGQ